MVSYTQPSRCGALPGGSCDMKHDEPREPSAADTNRPESVDWHQRYGGNAGHLTRHRVRFRFLGRTLVAAFVTLVVGIAGWVIVDGQRDSIQAALRSWDEPADGMIAVTVEVDRPTDIALICELVAVDIRHIVVGQLDLEIPAGGERRQLVDAEIPLRGDGIAPELRGCSPSS
jgi:hypothetical protein